MFSWHGLITRLETLYNYSVSDRNVQYIVSNERDLIPILFVILC
jgi:hypothetical protein